MDEPRSERQHRRFARQFDVLFWIRGNPAPYKGSATNVSAGGMFLASPDSQPLGTRLEIRFTGPHGFIAEGEVVHSVESGMGVRFLSTNELVAQLMPPEAEASVAAAPQPAAPQPAAPQPAAPQPATPQPAAPQPATPESLAEELGIYRVSFRDPAELRAVYERDLKTGGLFVPTRHPADLGAEVKLEISVASMPEGRVRLAGRVVQQAPGGIGVEILNLQSAMPQLQRLQTS